VFYDDLIGALGYSGSPLFLETEEQCEKMLALSDQHWIRSARKAGVSGSYLFKVSPEPKAVRPAVHVAKANTADEARAIHRKLWNQGVNPFLIVVLPGQVRIFTGFAYDPDKPEVGAIASASITNENITNIIETLSSFTADAINRGEMWQRQAEHLNAERRVDTTLLDNLSALGDMLMNQHSLRLNTSHALIGKFVYLSYLRARDILSDKWLSEEAKVEPTTIFNGETFAANVTLEGFRRLVRAVETRFNGKLFPIPWGSRRAPRADAIRTVARIFAGEEITGQMHLSFKAYDFASIPVEFLSSVYEQFLHAEDSDKSDTGGSIEHKDEASDPEKRGAHYTPEPLADYLVSEVDSVKPLRNGMRILDACCGSGIFLVIAYRRLIELECARQKCSSINASELRNLLETSIYGVERNRTACQIAGFSLILAMLSYVQPPELHQRKSFKFPTLVGKNLFPEDFFNETGTFWKKIALPESERLKFDWAIGNPPWVELRQDDPKAGHVLAWSKRHTAEYALARARTGEAFAWRVMECLASDGVVGLILHAKTLTNDHLRGWRHKFFNSMQVWRVTNFSNMKRVLFASARHPCITLIYQQKRALAPSLSITHFGPFLANQCAWNFDARKKRYAWSIGFSESEIKAVLPTETSDAATWKMALWGNQRDLQTIQRLRRVFSTTLGAVADERNWTLALGLQLRPDTGSGKYPNEEIRDGVGHNVLENLPVLDHRALLDTEGSLTIPDDLLKENTYGCFVRKRGGSGGAALTSGPRLFLWNDFAAYSDRRFIIRHDKACLVGGTADEMKAVAAIWNSHFASYLLFFVTTAAWGISYSHIDKGDAEHLPFPQLTPEREQSLCTAWEEAAVLESQGAEFGAVKALLDQRVAATLGIASAVRLVVSEFFNVRFKLNDGKFPSRLRASPDEAEIMDYAKRLRSELDGFLGGKAYHKITVLHSTEGISVSITLKKENSGIPPEVREAKGREAITLKVLLQAAETKFSQWTYVKRSVYVRDGETVHLIKPPRRLEWTQTQALLDADDFISEVIEDRTRGKT
jgi:hypothetical protein